MQASVRKSPLEVKKALASLGLTDELLRVAITKGEVARDSCTDNDPPNAPGFDAWARTVRALRETLIPKGWKRNDDAMLSTVVSPDGSVAIAVVTGDEGVGEADRIPHTKYPRGAATEAAVTRNQRWLFPEMNKAQEEADEKKLKQITWMLLRRRSKDKDKESVFAELSLPASMTKGGEVTRWLTRIILEPIAIEPTVVIDDGQADEGIDVPVRRRSNP